MELKTEKEINDYIKGLNKLIAVNKNRPCIEWQCGEALVKRCDKEPCKWCCYYNCSCCIHRDECVSKMLNKS